MSTNDEPLARWRAVSPGFRVRVLGAVFFGGAAFPLDGAEERWALAISAAMRVLDALGEPNRGALMNAEATASAHVVDAREALARIPTRHVDDLERAMVRMTQAQQEHATAHAALEAGGGR